MSIVEHPKNILAILISTWLSLKEALLLDSAVCNNGQRFHIVNNLVLLSEQNHCQALYITSWLCGFCLSKMTLR